MALFVRLLHDISIEVHLAHAVIVLTDINSMDRKDQLRDLTNSVRYLPHDLDSDVLFHACR